jgi:hypothetical protein
MSGNDTGMETRGTVGGGSKWLKDLVDDGSEERFNKWTICVEERLKLIKMY